MQAIDQTCHYLFIAFSLHHQPDHLLVHFYGISGFELLSPASELLDILGFVAIEGEKFEINPSYHRLVFQEHLTRRDSQNAVKEDHPTLKVSKISQVRYHRNMEGRVECLKDLFEYLVGVFIIVAQNLLNDVLEFGENIGDEVVKGLMFWSNYVLILLSNLSGQIDSSLDSSIQIF